MVKGGRATKQDLVEVQPLFSNAECTLHFAMINMHVTFL